MDSEANSNNPSAGNSSSNTSGQTVMASTDSESMAKLTPPRDNAESSYTVSEQVGGKLDTPYKEVALKEVENLPGSETHENASSPDAWQPLTTHMLGGQADSSSSITGNNKVTSVPEAVISPSIETFPSTALQNLDDYKGTKKASRAKMDDSSHSSKQQPGEKTPSNSILSHSVTRPSPEITDPDELKRKKKDKEAKFKTGKDFFCWQCHKDKANVSCSKCPRSYHPKCLISCGFNQTTGSGNQRKSSSSSHDITCPECKAIDDLERRPPRALKNVSRDELNSLLVYAIDSIKPTADPSFHTPVIKSMFPDYFENIIHPTDFHTIEARVKNNEYTSTQAFLSDLKWIVHNCCIYNNHTHPLTSNAKLFMKLTITKIVDLEICPDCFKNYHVKPKTWFTEVCRKPHALVWAKVVGHPFWPGKVVQVDQIKKEADVRFFGAHDRAWLPVDQCFMITENNCKSKSRNSRSKFDLALKELNEHIVKIETKLSIKFPFAEASKTPVDAKKPFIRLPKKEGEVSSEEEDDLNDDLDGPGLQIDESFKNPTDDESESSTKQLMKNGSGDASESDISPKKPKSAKKRKLSTINKAVESDEVKSKKTTPIISSQTPTVKPELPSPTIDEDDPMTDTTPVEEKDIVTLRKDVEKLKLIVKREKERCIEMLSDEKKRAEAAIAEAKKEFSKEKDKAVRDTRSRLEAAHMAAISETKKQQWCAQCAQPAVYYCCWNTSYCSYDCQNNHWQIHMNTCQQSRQTQHTVR